MRRHAVTDGLRASTPSLQHSIRHALASSGQRGISGGGARVASRIARVRAEAARLRRSRLPDD